MAYLIHLLVALLYLYLSHTHGSAVLNRAVGPLTTWRQWPWASIKALALLVALPLITGELLCMWLLDDWNFNRTLTLLPYWAVPLSNKTIITFLKPYFTRSFL